MEHDFIRHLLYDAHKGLISQRDEELKKMLIKHLNALGHYFNDENDFSSFFKERVRRISFESQLNYYEFYLDFVDDNNMGTFIGSYSDDINLGFEDGKVTVTIG